MKTKAIAGMVLMLFFVSIMLSNMVSVNAIEVDIAPATLNVNNNAGEWITAYIEPSVLFSDNFDSTTTGSDPAGWTESGVGVWAVVKDPTAPSVGSEGYGDVYCANASSTLWTRDFSFMTLSPAFGDGIFEFKFKLIDKVGVTERITIPARYQDDRNWILFDVDTGINYGRDVYCIFVSKGGVWTLLTRKDVTITKGVWHTMKIAMKGWNYEMWIDDVKELSTTDTVKAFSSGKIGLGVYRSTHAHFDNVLVTDIDINDLNVDTIQLWDVSDHITDVVPGSALFGDHDGDGIPDLTIKFDRATVANHLRTEGVSGDVELTIKAQVCGTWVSESDSVRVIAKGKATF